MATIQNTVLSVADGLKVVRLTISAGTTLPDHHSNVDVVVTVVRGNGEFTIEGTTRAVAQGDVVVLTPRQRHSVRADTEMEIVVGHARVNG